MKWEYIGTGLAFLGIGLSGALALPPPWWPKMPTQIVHIGLILAALSILIGLVLVCMGVWPQIAHYFTSIALGTIGAGFLVVACLFFSWTTSDIIYPSVAVGWGYNEAGPYSSSIYNPGSEPIVDIQLSIRNAGLWESFFSGRLGDAEEGLNTYPQLPPLPTGYYQIDIAYRGGRISQMLLLAAKEKQITERSWISDGRKLNIKPGGEIPPLPIFSSRDVIFDRDYGPFANVLLPNGTTLIAPSAKEGPRLDFCITNASNTTNHEIKIRMNYMSISIDGNVIFTRRVTPFIEIPASQSASFETPVSLIIPKTAKEITVWALYEAVDSNKTYTGSKITVFRLEEENGYPVFKALDVIQTNNSASALH